MHRNETPKPIWIKFCLVVDIPDLVTYTNFGDNRLRGFWVAGVKFPFPVHFHRRPYNTLALLCERVICDCAYFAYFSKVRISHIFPHKLAFSAAILILFVFLLPISIRFCYLNHLVANRMAPSMCPDPCGTWWGIWFQAVLYHISAYFRRIFAVYAVRIFLIKMPHKTDMRSWVTERYPNPSI